MPARAGSTKNSRGNSLCMLGKDSRRGERWRVEGLEAIADPVFG